MELNNKHYSYFYLLFLVLFIFIDNSASVLPEFGAQCDERYCIFSVKENTNEINIGEADKLCNKNKGYLLELNNEQIRSLLKKYSSINMEQSKKKVLLGFQSMRGDWKYIDELTGRVEKYSGEIRNGNDNEIYLNLVKKDGVWQKIPSYNIFHYNVICGKKPEKDIFCELVFNDICYFPLNSTYKWMEARKECFLRNATLASFNAVDLTDPKLKFLLTERSYWIGGFSEEWAWKFSTEYPEDSDWFLGNPSSNLTLNCAFIVLRDFRDQWFRGPCQDNYTVLCVNDTTRKVNVRSMENPVSLPILPLIIMMVFFNFIINKLS